jgi:malonyl-CoA O-methyltransferase
MTRTRAQRTAGRDAPRWGASARAWWARWWRGGPLDAEAAYARWAPVYPPRAHTPLMALEERAVLALLPDVTGRRALDLGCGTGRYTRHLARRGARVVSLDRSLAMLERAAPEARRRLAADARALPLAGGSVDLVVSGLMVADLPELDRVLAEVARVLAPRGWVIYSDLHPAGAALGWVRTFVDEAGRRWTVRHCAHTLRDHVVACQRAGLDLDTLAEPVIDWDHPHRGRPAALVVRARRR